MSQDVLDQGTGVTNKNYQINSILSIHRFSTAQNPER